MDNTWCLGQLRCIHGNAPRVFPGVSPDSDDHRQVMAKRSCLSYSGRRDPINLGPNFIRYQMQCSHIRKGFGDPSACQKSKRAAVLSWCLPLEPANAATQTKGVMEW